MKKQILTYIIILTAVLCATGLRASDGAQKGADQLFYEGNSFYEKRDYSKAVEAYRKVLDMRLESGNLYYNIGNSYFKLSKLGPAILYYEKARRFIPNDSDLKSNIAYARSLISSTSYDAPNKIMLMRVLEKPLKDFSLRMIFALLIAAYLVFMCLSWLYIANPVLGRRIKVLYMACACIFLLNLAAFAFKFYNEEFIRHAIVVAKEIECRYEPVESSTVYFNLYEGNKVVVLQDKDSWRKIRRPDGKVGWVRRDAVEEI